MDITFVMKLIHQPPVPITMHNIPSWWDEYPDPFHNGQSLIFHVKQSSVVHHFIVQLWRNELKLSSSTTRQPKMVLSFFSFI